MALVLVSGCGSASEAASLRAFVDGEGAFIGVYAGSSASATDVEVEWAMQFDNRAAQACPVAIYRWADSLPEATTLPSSAAPWPASWEGGELLDSGVVEPGASLVFGPALLDQGQRVDALLGVAVCPHADLELDVRAEVFADLGVRAIAEALSVELWRAD